MKNKVDIMLTPVKNSAYDCIQCSIATIGQQRKQEYRFCSLGRWGFSYHKHADNCIGESIYPHYFRNMEMGNELFGVHLHSVEGNEDEIMDKVVKILSGGEPLIVNGDMIHCPWYDAYQKYHLVHYYILSGYDKKKECFICVDAFITEKKIECAFNEIFRAQNSYYTVLIDEEKNIQIYLKELRKDIEYIKKSRMLKEMKEFAKDIRNNLRIEDELYGYNSDFFAVPIIDYIRVLAIHRLGYADMLQYLSEKGLKSFLKLSDMARNCGNQWLKVRMLLLKSAVTRSDNLNIRISEKVEECAHEEICFFMELEEVLKKMNF